MVYGDLPELYKETLSNPKGPCTPKVDTWPPPTKYLDRDCFNAKVYTIWVQGP